MSLDPERITKALNSINSALGHMNAMIQKSVSRMERASTKIVAAHHATRGVMMGVVADLDLMTGAFGKIKKLLANLFLPVAKKGEEGSKKIWRLFSAMTSLEGMWTHIIKPIKGNIKAGYEQSKLNKRLEKAGKSYRHLEEIGMQQAKEKYAIDKKMSGLQKALRGKWEGADPDDIMAAIPAIPFSGAKVGAGLGGAGATAGIEGVLRPTVKEKVKEKLKGTLPAAQKALEKSWTKMKKPIRAFDKNVGLPLRQIASGGLGLGFQATIVMGLMQAFASLFTIFQPIMDVVGALMERLSVGFMPVIMMVMDILTSEPVLAIIDMLAQVLAEVFSMFEPLIPIIIEIIQMALKPLMEIFEGIMPIIKIIADLFVTLLEAFMPIISILFDLLGPALTMITKIFLLLVVLGLYPLMAAIYGIGMFIAALITLFSFGTVNAIQAWNDLMMPIFGALNVATGEVLASFQTGTDFVPQTGIYKLERGERVFTPEENRNFSRGEEKIIINIDGGIWVQDLDEFTSLIGRKLSLIRG